jgi:phospholipase C
MLENRSFDHMLGFLKRENPAINGLNGNETNPPARDDRPDVTVSDVAADVQDLDPDPGHDFDDVTRQIFSSGDSSGKADMKGFVHNYNSVCGDPVHAENVMRCFKPQTLPILSKLAMEYGVCDRWFSSVPGSTIPNRMFVHGASSAGSASQDAIVAPFLLKTIYESFGPNTIHSYRIYTSGASILLANKYLAQHQAKFSDYSRFEADALHGNLPAYTFIEPRYDDDTAGGLFANSQHPDFPVDRGEQLVAEIYNILTKSPKWKSTLFLILYDEHGGLYDHVPPPKVTCKPENAHLPVPPTGPPFNFDFTRLGIRVPAVFVSPCIPRGTVISDQDYDHSSVVATVRKLFCSGTSPLTWREAQASTFDNVLTLEGAAIRNDVVDLPPAVISPGVDHIHAAEEVRGPTDLSVLIARTMDYSLKTRGIQSPGNPITLTTAAEVSDYLRQANQRSLNPAGNP